MHEEYHRAVLGHRGVGSFDDIYRLDLLAQTVSVSHVKDDDLVRMKAEHPIDFVRAAAAGIEGENKLIEGFLQGCKTCGLTQTLPNEIPKRPRAYQATQLSDLPRCHHLHSSHSTRRICEATPASGAAGAAGAAAGLQACNDCGCEPPPIPSLSEPTTPRATGF